MQRFLYKAPKNKYSADVKPTNQPVSFKVVLQKRPTEEEMWEDWTLSRAVWSSGVRSFCGIIFQIEFSDSFSLRHKS